MHDRKPKPFFTRYLETQLAVKTQLKAGHHTVPHTLEQNGITMPNQDAVTTQKYPSDWED